MGNMSIVFVPVQTKPAYDRTLLDCIMNT